MRRPQPSIELTARADSACCPFAVRGLALTIAQWGQGNMGISMMPGAGMGMGGLGGGGASQSLAASSLIIQASAEA